MNKELKKPVRGLPLPISPDDGTVVFHRDLVCQYYASSNTWACARVTQEPT